MSEWYEIDAAWDADGYASGELLKLGETREWCDLMDEVARLTHATAEEAYDGMAKALRDYLESLDNYGQIADMSGKSADCVRDGDAVSDSRESVREHSLESESVREQSDSVRERRYESQDVTGDVERVTGDGEMLHETREKLEADVREYFSHWIGGTSRTQAAIIGWLDRQAAITERECIERSTSERIGFDCAECAEGLGRELDARCDPLKARIAELEREIATLKEHRAANMEKLHELTDECAELRKYRDEWKGLAEKYRADSIAAQAETERYRAKLGDVLDALHEAERAAR